MPNSAVVSLAPGGELVQAVWTSVDDGVVLQFWAMSVLTVHSPNSH
jgi:hypothetical protein